MAFSQTAANTDTTTWEHYAGDGQLQFKKDDVNAPVDYDYHPSGELKTRQSARTEPGQPGRVTATYAYHNSNLSSVLNTITYSNDGGKTGNVTITQYDRRGRPAIVEDRAGKHTYTWHAGGLDGETIGTTTASGDPEILDGVTVDPAYDSFGRRAALAGTGGYVSYFYESTTSRLSSVYHNFVNSVTYGYQGGTDRVTSKTHVNSSTTVLSTSQSYDGYGNKIRDVA